MPNINYFINSNGCGESMQRGYFLFKYILAKRIDMKRPKIRRPFYKCIINNYTILFKK